MGFGGGDPGAAALQNRVTGATGAEKIRNDFTLFIGHFGAGLALKKAAPRVALGTLFLAAQFIDLVWPTLLLVGVERVELAPGAKGPPLGFTHYPGTHSLADGAGLGAALRRRLPVRAEISSGAVVCAVAWAGYAQWLLVAWACWIDRHRPAGGRRRTSEHLGDHFKEAVHDGVLGAAPFHARRRDLVAHLIVGGIVRDVAARAVAVGDHERLGER